MECLPLEMEPESRFYTSPVIVLNFQSLYPSMIRGKLSDQPEVDVIIAEGVSDNHSQWCFVCSERGASRLATEVGARNFIHSVSGQESYENLSIGRRVLERVFNARQFALKLIVNVAYGYTACGFSSRMPCAELADSIGQCGRRILEGALNMRNSNEEY